MISVKYLPNGHTVACLIRDSDLDELIATASNQTTKSSRQENRHVTMAIWEPRTVRLGGARSASKSYD